MDTDKELGIPVFGYARVSTKLQSLDMQHKDIKKFCNMRGYRLMHIYSDTKSGSDDNRTEYQQMLRDLKNKKSGVSCLLVYKIDRLSRSQKELISALDFFKKNDITFITTSGEIDTSTQSGYIIFSFMSMLAEFEKTLIQERVQAGIDNYIAKGGKMGRPVKTLDMTRIKMDIKDKIPKTVIAKKYGVSKTTLYKALNNPDNYTPIDPAHVKELRDKGMTIKELADEFGVTVIKIYECLDRYNQSEINTGSWHGI